MVWEYLFQCYCNFGIMVYIDVGKIMIMECILYYIGKLYKIGEVYDGVVMMDWMEQEQEWGIIIILVVMIIFWQCQEDLIIEGILDMKYCFNIIDIFGYVDFIIEVECLLVVFDGVICFFDVNVGVELQIEIVWCQVDCYKVLWIVFVNKMDKIGVDFFNCVKMIKDRIGGILCLIVLLIGVEDKLEGIVDLIKMEEWVYKGEDFGVSWVC